MTARLLNDISRCAGRFSLDEQDLCPRRESCARYVAMTTDRQRWPEGYPARISVSMGLCRDGGDFLIPIEQGEDIG